MRGNLQAFAKLLKAQSLASELLVHQEPENRTASGELLRAVEGVQRVRQKQQSNRPAPPRPLWRGSRSA
eukprot:4808278-Pyramimonas_sp.AAC.1